MTQRALENKLSARSALRRPPRAPDASVRAQASAEAAGTVTPWPHLHMSEKSRSQGLVYKTLQLLHLQKISKGL